jgi:hypothetical protein
VAGAVSEEDFAVLADVAGVVIEILESRNSDLECLKDREDDVLRFTTDLRIPPTSN